MENKIFRIHIRGSINNLTQINLTQEICNFCPLKIAIHAEKELKIPNSRNICWWNKSLNIKLPISPNLFINCMKSQSKQKQTFLKKKKNPKIYLDM